MRDLRDVIIEEVLSTHVRESELNEVLVPKIEAIYIENEQPI